jgi:hypothetical protein
LAYVTRPHDWRIRSAVKNPVGKKYVADTKWSLSNVSVVRERRYIEIH